MRYKIRRISVGSVMRSTFILGGVVAFLPALLLAWLVVKLIELLSAGLNGIQSQEISVLGQPVASIDLVNLLGLTDFAQTLAGMSSNWVLTFLLFTALFTFIGGILMVGSTGMAAMGYNTLAAMGGGIEVELRERP